jgi:copper chaperone CopZ
MLRSAALGVLISLAGCATDNAASFSAKPSETASATAVPGSLALHVKGMGCPLCATNVRKSLERVPGVEAVNIDLGTGVVKISAKANQTPEDAAVRKAVAEAGFELAKAERL